MPTRSASILYPPTTVHGHDTSVAVHPMAIRRRRRRRLGVLAVTADYGARQDHYLLAAMEASRDHTREAIRHAITAALNEIDQLRAERDRLIDALGLPDCTRP